MYYSRLNYLARRNIRLTNGFSWQQQCSVAMLQPLRTDWGSWLNAQSFAYRQEDGRRRSDHKSGWRRHILAVSATAGAGAGVAVVPSKKRSNWKKQMSDLLGAERCVLTSEELAEYKELQQESRYVSGESKDDDPVAMVYPGDILFDWLYVYLYRASTCSFQVEGRKSHLQVCVSV
eukprot:GHVQ01004657.1.p1 GENE.GHVQ01004657.1~~GHVQ01004657.1.p1  ORF type:complete len:176 (+),score=27.28 GHVQ01004657.1:181-708(+)